MYIQREAKWALSPERLDGGSIANKSPILKIISTVAGFASQHVKNGICWGQQFRQDGNHDKRVSRKPSQ